MESEKKYKNETQIYCIHFKNNDPQYEFGEFKGKSEEILRSIARIGGTYDFYTADSLSELYDCFNSISDAIQSNYSLEYEEKNN